MSKPERRETESHDPHDLPPAYLRLKRAALYVGLFPQTLLNLGYKGAGPPRIRKGRCVLYSVRALDEWMLRDQEAA